MGFLLVILWIIFVVVGIGLYLLQALGLYQMSVNAQIEYPWLAWIPIANLYILGKLIKKLYIGTFEVPYVEYVLPAGAILANVGIPVIQQILALAFAVVTVAALYTLYKTYKPGSETTYTIVTVVTLGAAAPVFIYMLKDNSPVDANPPMVNGGGLGGDEGDDGNDTQA